MSERPGERKQAPAHPSQAKAPPEQAPHELAVDPVFPGDDNAPADDKVEVVTGPVPAPGAGRTRRGAERA